MSLLTIGLTLSFVGKVLVILTVLHMHHTLIREHRFDKKVYLSYQQERILTWFGLLLIVAGFIIEALVR